MSMLWIIPLSLFLSFIIGIDAVYSILISYAIYVAIAVWWGIRNDNKMYF